MLTFGAEEFYTMESKLVDGWLARKLHAETAAGAILDSVADIIFVTCCAIRLLPALEIPTRWTVNKFSHFFQNIACDKKIKSYICIVNDINNN